MSTSVELFGTNSEGGMALNEWLDAMCLGCKHESARQRRENGGAGGIGCDLVARAICEPYTDDIEEWTGDAAPLPERVAELGRGPWPVCMAWEPRKTRADKGVRRGPKVSGMDALFDLGAA